MPSIQPGIAINSDDAAQRTPPSSFRRIMATLFKQDSAGSPIAGVLPASDGGATPLEVVASSSGMTYTVRAGYAVTTRAGEGAYILGTPVNVSVPTSASHASLSRIDRIYIVQPDYEKSETGDPRIDVAVGTPASSPVAPAIPAGALELGRKVIAAGASNTSTGAAITNRAPMTGLNIGSITFAQISDPQNVNAAKLNGKRWTPSTSEPTSPSVGDVWVDYS